MTLTCVSVSETAPNVIGRGAGLTLINYRSKLAPEFHTMSSSRYTALPLNTCLTARVGFKVREEGREVESNDGLVCDSLCNDQL